MKNFAKLAWTLAMVLAAVPGLGVAEQGSGGGESPASLMPDEQYVQEVLKGLGDYWEGVEEARAEAPGAAEPIDLDVRRCVELALAQNARVLVAQDEVDAAQALVGQAKSARLPQVKVQEGYSYIQALEGSSGLGGVLGSLFSSGLLSDTKVRRDQFSLTQVVYAGGQIQAAMRASEYLAQSQEWQRQATLDGLEFEAKQAYYAVLLTRALVRVAEESVVTFERHLSDAQQALDVGVISNFVVLRAKTELGARKSDTVTVRDAERLALLNLRRVLALAQDTPIRLAAELACEPLPGPPEELIRLALEHRPELLALRKGLGAAKEDIVRRKGSFKPRAAANAEWTNTDGGGTAAPDGWTFSIGAEWDLYVGGRRKHEVAEAKARVRGLEHQIQDVERLIELDVRRSIIQINDAAAKIRSEQGNVELGREGLRLAELRFQEGVGTQAETLDAELALTAAESSLVRALHDYAVAHASLKRATAQSSIDRERPSP